MPYLEYFEPKIQKYPLATIQQQKNVVVSSIAVVNKMTTEVTAETQEIASSIEEQTSATSKVTMHATYLK